ncbi:PREDICTED: aquaporin-6-like [Gekko japonicus]|uniref:Aquaporin-6-like n=1 Tax=Gekko japonicus TaxID=146911 RepID=A0ABM1JUA8_GEKJA|nr:PREDICTED: aquaporin-6-like [Gekko japonicus]
MGKELCAVSFYRAAFTEFLVTAIYVFFGVGSMLRWPVNTPSILQISITFNLAAATAVQIAWHASGAHVNPAVTVAFLLGSRISLAKAACYVVAQLAGGIAGAAILYAVTPGSIRGNLGINTLQNNLSPGQAVAVEIVLTLQMVLCYFASTDSLRSTGSPAVMIGISVSLGHLIGSYLTSCSMNPARSFGPAVIVRSFPDHWVFWVGPLSGAVLASLLYNFVIYHDSKSFAQRLAILKGSYVTEQLENDGTKQIESRL